jgi:hypothetical protein
MVNNDIMHPIFSLARPLLRSRTTAENAEVKILMRHETITRRVIDAAMKVHTALGAGLLESTYDVCLVHEFTLRGLQFQRQLRLPVTYDTVVLDAGYRSISWSKIVSLWN